MTFSTYLRQVLSFAFLPLALHAAPEPIADDPACTVDDRKFMVRAYELGRIAGLRGDMPVGAVLVKDGKVICEYGNTVTTDSDITMHGETGLISHASRVLPKSTWEGATLYTSFEPCTMCVGSIHWAGLKAVVYGGEIRQPSGAFWGPERLRIREAYKRYGWAIEVRGPLMDSENLKMRAEVTAARAAKP